MSNGTAGIGTTISIGGVPIGGVGDITGPGSTFDWTDTTTHDSPNRTEQGLPTVRRTGTCTFPLVIDFTDVGQQDLLAAHEANPPTEETFVITYPEGTTKSFQGFVMGFDDTSAVTGHLSAAITIRPNGLVTTTPSGS